MTRPSNSIHHVCALAWPSRDVDVAEIEGKSQAAHHALREALKAR